MDTLFLKKDLLRSGWHKTKEHFWFLFLVQLFVVLVSWVGAHLWVLSLVVGILLSISIITIALMFEGGMKPSFKDLFKKYWHYRVFVNYLLSSLIAAVVIGVGLLFLVVPGIYIALRIQFYKFLIVDKGDIGPWMAIKESWKMTDNHTWNLFLFTLLVILINFVGLLLFGLGLFVSFPVSLIAYAFLYRKLLQNVSLTPAPSAA